MALSQSVNNPRLNEFFDLIRGEFDTANQEGTIWKIQRDEYEQKSEHSANLSAERSVDVEFSLVADT
jgi:hypothetical protein